MDGVLTLMAAIIFLMGVVFMFLDKKDEARNYFLVAIFLVLIASV